MSTTSKIQILIQAVDKASAELKNVGNSVKGLSDKIGGLGSTAKVAAGVLLGQLAHDALGALTSAAGEASQGFMDYEETLTKIVSATSLTGDKAKELSADLAKVSESQTDLGFTAADASKALEALVKAGMSGADAAKALRSALSLARLEGIDSEKSASLLVQTLTMFGLKASDSAEALDLLSKAADAGIDTAAGYASGIANAGAAAHNMGLSLDETLAALVQLDKTYGSATESGTYLNSMFKDLIAKSDKLGITLYNQDGTMKSLNDIVGQLRKKVKSFGKDQKKINKYLSVFDVRAQRAVIGLINYDGSISDTMDDMADARSVQEKMNMIMDTTAGKTAKAQAEMENASYALGEMTAQMSLTWKQFALGLGPIGAVADSLGPSMLQGAISGVMMMLPSLISSIGGASGAMSAMGVAAHAMLGPIGLLIAAITALGLAYSTNFLGFRDAVDGAANYISNTALPAMQSALSGFADWLTNAWNTLTSTVSSGWEATWNGIQAFVNDPIGTTENAISSFGSWIQDSFSGFMGNVKETWNTVLDAIAEKYPETASVLKDVQSGFSAFMSGDWYTLGKSIRQVLIDLGPAVSELWNSTLETLQSAATNAWTFLNDSFSNGLNSISGFFSDIGAQIQDTFINGLTAIQNFVVDFVTSLPQQFSQGLTALVDAVLNWGPAVVQAFSDALNGIVTAITDFFRGLVGGSIWTDGLQSVLDVTGTILAKIGDLFSSFVEKALDWGKNLIQNFIDGIKSVVDSLTSTISDIGAAIADFLGIGSPAKKGPLRNLMRWGPNLTKSFAEGILSGLPKVTKAAESVAGTFSGIAAVQPNLGGVTAGFARPAGNIEINVVVQGDASEDTAKLAADLILKKMRKYVVS